MGGPVATTPCSLMRTVTIPAAPPLLDVELAIDTTQSMTASLNRARNQSSELVTQIQSRVPAANFAAVVFRDSGDGAQEYRVLQPMTSSGSAIQSAFQPLSTGGGGDAPEAHNLVFRNSYTPAVGGDIGWRDGSRKVVVVVSDAEPHNARASVPQCSDTIADPHSLQTASELMGMRNNTRTLFMVRQGGNASASLPCYQALADLAYPTGKAINATSSLVMDVLGMFSSAAMTVTEVRPQIVSTGPAPAAASWLTITPERVMGPLSTPSNQTFTVTVNVPAATPAGTYLFEVAIIADGADLGHHTLRVVVPGPSTDCYVVVGQP